MENNGWSYDQQHRLLRELIQGMEMAKQLRLQLNSGSSMEARESLAQKILCSYEKALLILNWGQQQQNAAAAASASAAGVIPVVVAASGSVPESPISMNGSPGSDDFDGGHFGASKKRKTMPRWTDHVRVSSENGLEGPQDDGYNWRKYGQKDILGAKYPRSYYRCTYRNTQNCWATKQVQRSDDDPNVFDITYRGVHTCSHGQQSIPPPTSPEKQDHKQNNISNSYQQQQQQSQETLFNFQKTLRVNTEDLDNKETTTFPFSFPPSFMSPTTPEPGYYSVSPFQMNSFAGVGNLQYSDSFSANTSAANSPLAEPDFTLQALELDPNFGFFS
ncbi:probable WRKY transcription factor 53 [Euphorbia lathyris]|uniref:probable WRKY transcription factor 53 n=1 Tax=Euphorbia lathyris TaxID=212925 RepID=UPI0033143731